VISFKYTKNTPGKSLPTNIRLSPYWKVVIAMIKWFSDNFCGQRRDKTRLNRA